MDYMATIRRGLELTWNNKFLWVLGFLAALGSGASFSNSNYSVNSGDPAAMAGWMTPERMAALTTGLVAFGCIAFIVGILLWLVSLSARGGLIGAVAQLERGAAKPSFGGAFRMGWRRIGRLVGMTIVLYIVPVILFIILMFGFVAVAGGLAFIASGTEDPGAALAGAGGLALVFMCLLCLLIPLAIVLSLIYAFAFRGIMLRDLGVMDSIRHGWQVVRKNLGQILLLGLAFFLIGIIILILTAAIIAPLALLVGVPMVALMESDATFLQGLLAVLGIVVGLVIFALVSAVTTAWQSATFTLAYMQWTGKDVLVEG